MDAYELFIRHQPPENYIPTPDIIYALFIQGNVRTLELVALMYEATGTKIEMDKVYQYGHGECLQMADIMLTPIVVRNSLFKEVESSVQSALAAFADMRVSDSGESKEPRPDDRQARLKALPLHAQQSTLSEEAAPTRPNSPQSSKEEGSVDSEALSEALTDEIVPKQPGFAQPLFKPSRNYVVACNEFFLDKSKTRIATMTRAFKCRVKMSWVRGVASRLEPDEGHRRNFFMLTGSERHVHRTGSTARDFVRALADPVVKTFSWSFADDEAIHIPNCRAALMMYCSKNKPEQYLPLAMIACSIGLPTFQLYTPCSFLKGWRRFKDVTNANIVKSILRRSDAPDTVQELLDRYSPKDVVVDCEPSNVELFMFKYWYSYPTKSTLGRLVEYANANLIRCLGINDVE